MYGAYMSLEQTLTFQQHNQNSKFMTKEIDFNLGHVIPNIHCVCLFFMFFYFYSHCLPTFPLVYKLGISSPSSRGRHTRCHSSTLWTGILMEVAPTWRPSLTSLRRWPRCRWGVETTLLWSTAGEASVFVQPLLAAECCDWSISTICATYVV